jgi:hypothetical protein
VAQAFPTEDYTISGYSVIKKWLSYREKELLGRSLSVDEARYVTDTARRLAALMLLGPQLDENYRTTVKEAYKLVNQTRIPGKRG